MRNDWKKEIIRRKIQITLNTIYGNQYKIQLEDNNDNSRKTKQPNHVVCNSFENRF